MKGAADPLPPPTPGTEAPPGPIEETGAEVEAGPTPATALVTETMTPFEPET
jgi:hypothetical protein